MNNVTLYTKIGIIQKHESIDAMLAEYNKHGKFYEVVKRGGTTKLYHKSSRRCVGEFRNA